MPDSALPPRISRLRVKNFRSIAEMDILLGPLTVLIGPNGSGKSNVVDALRFVRDVFTRGLDQAVMDREGMDVIRRWNPVGEAEGEVEIEVTVTVAEGETVYGFGLLRSESGNFSITTEYLRITHPEHPLFTAIHTGTTVEADDGGDKLYHDRNLIAPDQLLRPVELFDTAAEVLSLTETTTLLLDADTVVYDVDNPEWGDRFEILEQLVAGINNSLFYGLNPADLRQPQRSLVETPMDEHGRNLAAVLRRLLRVNGPALEELRAVLRRAVAGFDDLAVETVGGYLATKLLYTTASGEARASYLGQESDGTIRMLGILAALLQDPPQAVVTIEEPEANIHPGALGVLAETFLEASRRGQVILTTHSPDLMTHLPAECFLLVEKVDGETRVGPLDAGQAEIVRQHLFSAGELMRMQGLHRRDSAPS